MNAFQILEQQSLSNQNTLFSKPEGANLLSPNGNSAFINHSHTPNA